MLVLFSNTIMLYGIIGLIIGFLICFFIIRPKLKKVENYNSNIKKENSDLFLEQEKLKLDINLYKIQ